MSTTPQFRLAATLTAALSTACSPLDPEPIETFSSVTQPAPPAPLYRWFDDHGAGEVKIRINLANQKAYYTRGGRPIGWSYVAAGKASKPTPTGHFTITEKLVDKHSNRYGWIENAHGVTIDHDASPGDPVPPGGRYVPAPMPYWMRITDYGIGLHAGPIPNPGRPASHGCIRLPSSLAPLVFRAVRVGTPVHIHHGRSDEANPEAPEAVLPVVGAPHPDRFFGRR